MYIRKHLNSFFVSFFGFGRHFILSLPFGVASLILICPVIESGTINEQAGFYNVMLESEIAMLANEIQASEGGSEPETQAPEETGFTGLLNKIKKMLFAGRNKLKKVLSPEYLLKEDLLLMLRESLRSSRISDSLINKISELLETFIAKNPMSKKLDQNYLILNEKIIDKKSIYIIIKNIKNLIIQIKKNKGISTGIDQYSDKFDNVIFTEVKNLINAIATSISEISEYLNQKDIEDEFQLNKLDNLSGKKNSFKIEITNEIIDTIGLIKTKSIYDTKTSSDEKNNEIIEIIKTIISKISQIIQKSEKIEIIKLKLILIKRIINLIKEIEIKENPTKENLIREINQILEMVNTIISLLGNDGDSIDKTVQTILDMKLGKTNKRDGIIRNTINLLNLLKEVNVSDENINPIVKSIYNMTKIVNSDTTEFVDLINMAMSSLRTIYYSMIKKPYF